MCAACNHDHVAPLPFKRMLSRVQAAYYLDIGVTKFDQMVMDGRMPRAKKMDGRKAWDIRQIDLAIDALPTDGDDSIPETNSWSDA
jgi:hypothetical protein